MNPEEPDIPYNFDYEIPCYVYGYYNGDTNNMGDEEVNELGVTADALRQELAEDIAERHGTDPWREEENTDGPRELLRRSHRRRERIHTATPDIINRELYENRRKENKALDGDELLSRLRDRRLSSKGYPSADSFIGQNILICVGDGEIIYEARITTISSRARSVFLEQSLKPKGRTITTKMVGWWKIEKIKFIDKLIAINPVPQPEKDMSRTIL